jgi:hypothetical protein
MEIKYLCICLLTMYQFKAIPAMFNIYMKELYFEMAFHDEC